MPYGVRIHEKKSYAPLRRPLTINKATAQCPQLRNPRHVDTPLAPVGQATIGASDALEELFTLTHKVLDAFLFVISRPLPEVRR